MPSVYVMVKWAQLALSAFLIIMGIVELVQTAQVQSIVFIVIFMLIQGLGVYATIKVNRHYLYAFAGILLATMIIGIASGYNAYALPGIMVALILLAIGQAELLRRGFN